MILYSQGSTLSLSLSNSRRFIPSYKSHLLINNNSLFIFSVPLVLIFYLLLNFMCWLDNTSSGYEIQREQNNTHWKVSLCPNHASPFPGGRHFNSFQRILPEISKYIRKWIIHIIFTEMLAKHTHCSLPVPSPIMIFHPHEVYVVNNYIYVPSFF